MTACSELTRSAVVDLGSNSVRLVVFEGLGRNPVAIFNEKATLRLGSGLHATGRLNEEATCRAIEVLARYATIAHAMRVERRAVLATAAVRDAGNGSAFVEALRAAMSGWPIIILSGEEEARYAAAGLLCGIPSAQGLLADIGGGSLELVRLAQGRVRRAITLRLGVIRLGDRAAGDLGRARRIVEGDLAEHGWLGEEASTLFLVGGGFRALAKLHMMRVSHPLHIVHHYAVPAEEAAALAEMLEGGAKGLDKKLRRAWEAGISRRRLEDLPLAACVLRGLLRAVPVRQVVFSANGLREGWYMAQLAESERHADPMLAAGQGLAHAWSRDPTLPPALIAWTDELFADEHPSARRLREAACWMSDTGSHDHPEYRAELALRRLMLQAGVALDHPARAFLGYAIACRYGATPDAPYLKAVLPLLTPERRHAAELLGAALRLGYALCAGTPTLLAGSALRRGESGLTLSMAGESGFPLDDSAQRRLRRLVELAA